MTVAAKRLTRNSTDGAFLKSLALDAAIDGIAILENSLYTYLNPSHAQLYGYEVHELLGQGWQVLYDPKEAERLERDILPELDRNGHVRADAVGRRKDGSAFYQEISLTNVESRFLICVVRDVSRRELALQEAERLRQMVLQSPHVVFAVSDEGTVQFRNPEAQIFLNLHDGGSSQLQDLLPELDWTLVRQNLKRGNMFSIFIEREDRKYRIVAMPSADSRMFSFYGSDVTELVRVEGDLIRSQRILRKVLDTDPNLIFVKDKNGTFILVNEAIAALYGASADTIVGKSDRDFNPSAAEIEHFLKDDLEVITQHVEKRILEEPVTDSTGQQRIFSTVKRPLQIMLGEETYVLGVSTDITAVRNLREQLGQAQKMEALGQLAGGVAHDFNNLLTAISGCADILKLKQDPQEVLKSADMIQSAAQKAKQLTEQLLAFARQGKHQHMPLDLHAIVRDTLNLMQRTIDPSIHIETNLFAKHSICFGDTVQLQQVVLNLIINARDAIEALEQRKVSGRILLSTRNLTSPADKACIELAVEDSGCGMTDAVRSKIFDPFFTTKETGKGTGLGLSVVYGIVQNHSGEIDVETSPGSGSIFRVRLALANAAAVPDATAGQPAVQKGSGRVLVIDDHPDVREVSERMLTSLGYGVFGASSARKGLDILAEQRGSFDLILIDLVMPGMRGDEALRELRRQGDQTPAIIMTGFGDQGCIKDLMNEGIDILQKPFQLEKLASFVEKRLRASRG